jgi:hypothetical protein
VTTSAEKIPALQPLSWTVIWRDVRKMGWTEHVAGRVEMRGKKYGYKT